MPSEHIQWFPGHMAKTRRLITENLKNVHIIIEVLDARVPVSSRNPELRKMTGDKPTILLLNKAALADPKKNKEFVKLYTDSHTVCILCDCVTGEGLNKLPEAIRTVLKDRVERYEDSQWYAKENVLEKTSYEYLTKLSKMSNEDATELNLIKTELEKYIKEAVIDFIKNGVTDKAWNEFVETSKGIGSEKYVKLYQDAYDAYLAK
jgi:tRNA U34 5-carboxymethylaminomethyl modifying GTPase MnmE/TrmE